MKILRRYWRDLEDGHEKVVDLDWQAWVEGGGEAATKFCHLHDDAWQVEHQYEKRVEAADRRRRQAGELAFRFLRDWLVFVAAVVGALWLLRTVPAENPLGKLLATACEAVAASGKLPLVAAVLTGMTVLLALAWLGAEHGSASWQEKRAMREFKSKGLPAPSAVLNAPSVSVMRAWVELLTKGDAGESGIAWNDDAAVEELLRKFAKRLPGKFIGLVNVPITPTSTVDLLVVGPSGVWALELGGPAPSAGLAIGGSSLLKAEGRQRVERLRRVEESVYALMQLLQNRSGGVDLGERVAGTVVDLKSAWMEPRDALAKHKCDGCWVCCLRSVQDGAWDEPLDEVYQWRILGAIARNAAEMTEEHGESSVSLAESAYDHVLDGIRGILQQGAGL